ncbi:hypothetical protein HYV74_03010 [Candidatus Uhrbacteria bacterium]|nr:hypothetical protein [Candidatus Uhrbacteria bacterium]
MKGALALATMALSAGCATHRMYDPYCGAFTGTQMEYERFIADCEALRTTRAMRSRNAQDEAIAEDLRGALNAEVHRNGLQHAAPEYVATTLLQSLAQRDLLRASTRLAVLPPDCRVADAYCVAVQARMEQQIVAANQCTVIERVRLLEILHELHYQQNPAGFDEESAVEVGRFVGATHVLLLTVTAPPEQRALDLSARVVDVEHAIIVASAHETFRN